MRALLIATALTLSVVALLSVTNERKVPVPVSNAVTGRRAAEDGGPASPVPHFHVTTTNRDGELSPAADSGTTEGTVRRRRAQKVPSASKSISITRSTTRTPSPSKSMPKSVSPTKSTSLTRTPTKSSSLSRTQSKSASASRTPTKSTSLTRTPTKSSSLSRTQSKSASASRTPSRSRSPSASNTPLSPNLAYYGGPIISNVVIHPLFPNSDTNFQSEIVQFYNAIATTSAASADNYYGLLSQYSTPTQALGFGYAVEPYVGNLNSSVTDIDDFGLQLALTGLFLDGTLAPATANDYYPIHFAPGVHIHSFNSTSCVDFCGYHNSFNYNDVDGTAHTVFYGVLPDLTDPSCYCWGDTTSALNNVQSVASHELAETVTDADVGHNDLAWYCFLDNRGEIGDICAWQLAPAVLGDGVTYTVQKLWSNVDGACVTGVAK